MQPRYKLLPPLASLGILLLLGTVESAESGDANTTAGGTGFFRVEKIDNTWWFIDPDGQPFISVGVNHVSYTADTAPKLGYAPYGRATKARYGSEQAWAAASVQRLRKWGFNTIGAWSSAHTYKAEMAYAPTLGLGSRAGGDWLKGRFPDVFSDDFSKAVNEGAAEKCAPRRNDRWLLGYFTDNELKWGPDWRSPKGMLAGYWELPPDSPGRRKAVAFLREYYQHDFARFRAAWKANGATWEAVAETAKLSDVSPLVGDAQKKLVQNELLSLIPKQAVIGYLFLQYGTIARFNAAEMPEMGKKAGTTFKSFAEVATPQSLSEFDEELAVVEAKFTHLVAKRYFQECHDAIRRHDPNHLILGCRFAMKAPQEVAEAMGDNTDVVSLNFYNPQAPDEHGQEIYEWTAKPLLITEFGFKAMDSGLPNTKGAGLPVATQKDRANGYEKYVTELMKLPFAVGFHWFEHADEPAEGRFDGENCNYGLVNIEDDPWTVLTERMTKVNARLTEIH
jgi:hypothetical protein